MAEHPTTIRERERERCACMCVCDSGIGKKEKPDPGCTDQGWGGTKIHINCSDFGTHRRRISPTIRLIDTHLMTFMSWIHEAHHSQPSATSHQSSRPSSLGIVVHSSLELKKSLNLIRPTPIDLDTCIHNPSCETRAMLPYKRVFQPAKWSSG